MSEQTASDDLVAIGRFNTPVEASLAQNWLAEEGIEARLDGDATANWLNYWGSQLIGARLWVKQSDLSRAQELLKEFEEEQEVGEEIDEEDEEYLPTPPLTRAYRAAVMGTVVLPPLLSLYSLFLVLKHRLWEPQPGEESVNWRFYATILFQIVGLSFFWWLVVLFRE